MVTLLLLGGVVLVAAAFIVGYMYVLDSKHGSITRSFYWTLVAVLAAAGCASVSFGLYFYNEHVDQSCARVHGHFMGDHDDCVYIKNGKAHIQD